ncbi:MAG: MinD/ParA family protein [Bdellovibrionales bacterium]|nr:MinD/ParA family protein [Bdellovibrionales bacterium]
MNTRKSEDRSRPARVLSVTSGKGGVGKTHTTVNLGLALVKLGKRVLLLDADIGLANINIMLGFKPASTLLEVVRGGLDIEDVIVHHASGLDIIPATSGVTDMTNLSEEERITLVGAFDNLANKYDFMLVDTGAGIGTNVLYFNEAAEQILVVVDPEPTSITDAYALIKVLSTQCAVKEFDIVVNRAPVGSDGREIFAKLAAATDRFLPVRLSFLGAIADDESVSQAVRRQTPFLELYPSTRASRDISRLAKKVAESPGSRTPKGGVQFFFRALLEQ